MLDELNLRERIDLSTPGRRLRFFRTSMEWSQQTAARKVFVSQATWSLWERDELTPDLPKQHLVAELFKVSRTFLFDGEPFA